MTGFAAYSNCLRRGLGVPNVILRTTASTNVLARSIVSHEGVARDPWPLCWLIAFEQVAGRGRLGRHWTSEPGVGIYATLLMELTDWEADRISLIPLLVGNAAAQSLRAPLAGTPLEDGIQLKWPNDLVVLGRKLGGVLIESLENDHRRFGIVGIGVNHGQLESELPEARATSLRQVHRAADAALPSLGETAVALCRAVGDALDGPSAPDRILDDYRALSVHRQGDELSWSSHDGPVRGRFVEIDSDGAIVIATSTGPRRVSSGDVLQVEGGD